MSAPVLTRRALKAIERALMSASWRALHADGGFEGATHADLDRALRWVWAEQARRAAAAAKRSEKRKQTKHL